MAKPRPGMGRGLEAILSVSARAAQGREEELRELPVELISPNPKQPRGASTRRRWRRWRESLGERGVLQPVLVRPEGRGDIRAGGRRAALAGGAASPACESIPAIVRQRDDARGARARADREHGARGPQPDRGGARVRGAGRGARADARGGGPPRRPQPRGGQQPGAPARPARRGDRAAAARGAQRGPRTGAAAGRRSRRAAEPGARGSASEGWSVRVTEDRAREQQRRRGAADAALGRRRRARPPSRPGAGGAARSPRRSRARSAPR